VRFSAWFSILIGAMVFIQWAFFLVSGSVPELETAPWEIGFHMAAEALMAVLLIIGGWALLKRLRWGVTWSLVGLGTLVYSAINSSGYFAQREQWVFVGMFAVLLVGALASIITLSKSRSTGGTG
jgi:hypothetical protein